MTWWRWFRERPAGLRVAAYVTVLLVLVLVAGLVTAAVALRRPLAQTSGELELRGLEGEVEVVRDEHGVPHLYGDSVEDLMRGQGFVHAQERFFEMDLRRHATAGRLAELVGEKGVESDRLVRTMDWRGVAEQELSLVAPTTRMVLDAYAEGVNAFLAGRGTSELAVEYAVLGLGGLDYTPEEWTAVDSLAWLKAMAWDLRGNMGAEIDRVLAAAAVGQDRAATLWPSYNPREAAPILTQGAVVDGTYDQDAESGTTSASLRPGLPGLLRGVRAGLESAPSWLGRGEGLGSNSWVVSGELSATGLPLLANDPHLGVSLPGVWMQVGLHCRQVSATCPLDVSGFSFSGVPGVMIGHNGAIAWGFTNLGPDVTDLYLERIVGDQWRQDGRLLPLRTRTETIEVAGGEDVSITVRETTHGPIVSDVSEELGDVAEAGGDRSVGDEYAVSLAWTALEPTPTTDAIYELNIADDWESFRDALRSFAAPGQNVVYADRDGHIGYQATGLIPIRAPGHDGGLPAPGWRSAYDWSGEHIAFESLPSVLDPDEDFVVAANQAVVADYPYYLTDDFDRGYRAQRIRDLLVAEGELSLDETAALQLDTLNPMAPVLTPYLLDVRVPRGYYSSGVRLLEGWDFEQPASSAAAAYYNVVWSNLLELTFGDELPEDLGPDGGNRWMAVVQRLLREPADPWWDDVSTEDSIERRDDIIRGALLAARDELTRRIGPVAEEWSWGALHALELRSATLGESGVAPLEWLVNRGPWELGGGSAIVDASGWDAAEGYAVTTGASMRMVVSLEDLDESRWINMTGVSGHPASPHYTDQTDLWAQGRTLPWPFTPDAVTAAGVDTLTLVPAAGE